MSLNLYDLLDVDEAATSDQIRAAWKAAIADLDPTDRRFRAYNDAAGVLLDGERRAAYDAELAEQRADAAEPEDAPTPVAPPAVEPPQDAAPVAETREVDESVAPKPPSDGPGLVLIAVAAVAAILAVVLAVWVLAQPNAKATADANASLAAADTTVEQLVADKVVPSLSYDYRSMDENLKDVQQYMTPAMAAKEQKSWGVLSAQAKQQRAIVTSESPMTGLTRMSADGKQAVVVAYINQHVRKAGATAFDLKMWATFVLDKDAATGSWLVDDICTDRLCS